MSLQQLKREGKFKRQNRLCLTKIFPVSDLNKEKLFFVIKREKQIFCKIPFNVCVAWNKNI